MKLSKFEDKNGKQKWRCSWIDQDTKKRKFKQFASKVKGEFWILDQQTKKAQHGQAVSKTETVQLAAWLELDTNLREVGRTLLEAGELLLKQSSVLGVESVQKTLSNYLEERRKAGRQQSTLSATRGKVTRLLGAHPKINLLETAVREVTLQNVKEAMIARSSSISINGLEYERQRVRDFFSWCLDRDLVTSNPTPEKSKDAQFEAKKRKGDVAIFTPIEARELLRDTHALNHAGLMAWVVLGLFCGVRPDSTFRTYETKKGGKKTVREMQWSAIHNALKTGKLEVHDKVGVRSIPLTPEAKVWLEWLVSAYGIKQGAVVGSNWANNLKAFRKGWRQKNKVKRWPTDVLRHSFGTYRMHTIQSTAQLADEMGNSPSIIEKYYFKRGVDPQDVREFWNLTPEIFDEATTLDLSTYKLPKSWHDDMKIKVS